MEILLLVLLFIMAVIAALLLWGRRVAVTKQVVGGGPTVRIGQRLAQPAGCVPDSIVKAARRIAQAAIRRDGFGPPRTESVKALHACGLNERAAESLYRQEVMQLAARSAKAHVGNLHDTPTAAARKQQVPPMQVVRARLGKKHRVHAEQIEEAQEADYGSAKWQQHFQRRAQVFELALGAELNRRGVAYEDEAALRARGAVLTPDFLLREPLMIGGQPVRWLDAKDFFHYGSPILARAARRSVKKYTRAFGPGALVFSCPPSCQAAQQGPGLMLNLASLPDK